MKILTTFIAAITLLLVSACEPTVDPPDKPLSRYETENDLELDRDCGFSAPLPQDPSLALWVFCDTIIKKDGEPYGAFPFRPGSFGAVGTNTVGQVPVDLSHLPSPPEEPTIPNSDFPGLILPAPTDLVTTTGGQCRYQANWISGLQQGPEGPIRFAGTNYPDASKFIFIPYHHVCVEDTNDPDAPWGNVDLVEKRFGVSIYDPELNKIVRDRIIYEVSDPLGRIPIEWHLLHPTFSDGYMNMYTPTCTDYDTNHVCNSGEVNVTRAPTSGLSNPNNWEFKTDVGWSTDYTQATDILPPRTQGSWQVDVGDFRNVGRDYIMLEQIDRAGNYRQWVSDNPIGPWTLQESGRFPCSTEVEFGCYHLWSHPHLSTSTELMYSYYDIKPGQVTLFERDV